MRFSKVNREKYFKQSENNIFDVLVIGGGVTGAGIVLDAVSRGLSTALFEKDDFAQGTSSKSTKLVHGGLRYLKSFDIKLVRDAGRERAILYQNASHIVYPQKMLIPIYKSNTYGKLLTSFALWIYDLLAGVETRYTKRTINKSQVLERNPKLKPDALKGGVEYFEYRTNDARLVIESIKKANELGALVLNYSNVIKIEKKEEIVLLTVLDQISGKEFLVKTKVLINATGMWVDDVLQRNRITKEQLIFPSKGIHIVIDKSKLEISTSVYFELNDGRMIFVIPNKNKIYVGTTDDKYTGDYDNILANTEEINYLLTAVCSYFDCSIGLKDVEISWAGVRPLVYNSRKTVDKMSRKEKLIVHRGNIISVFGGKLTAYRLMAEKTIDKVLEILPKSNKIKPCTTKEIALSGGDFDFGRVEPHKLVAYEESLFYHAYQLNATTEFMHNLFQHYGKNTELIIDRAFDIYNKLKDRSLVWLEAEIWYVANYEMLVSISDFMMRRTDRFFFDHTESINQLQNIAKLIAVELDLSEEEIEKQIYEYKEIAKQNHSLAVKND